MQDEVALPLDQGLLVKTGKIKWDQPVEQSCELKIAQVDDDLRKENFRFLVLQKHTDRYERIGICISDWNRLKGLANINEVWQEWDRLDIGYYRQLLSAGTGLQTSGQDRTPRLWQRALIKWKRPKFDFIHVNENDMWGLVRASLKEEQVILA
ncbi:hypothetical protein B5807_03138 [Epicoccum nigrum]|uniref:Uncharacterized protein n=1 Tax=Epicoccum nigrum TaxID=105696 RepID=A0A1Y2M6B6_EPING|nr:hypothetical protein B5807_03138 [Epicoccum nigrum]